jgi:hypothetical protein
LLDGIGTAPSSKGLTAEHAENAETRKINDILSADSAVSAVKRGARAGVNIRLARGKSAPPLADKYKRAGTCGGEEGKFAPAPQLQALFIALRLLSRFVLCAGSLFQL